MTVGLWHLGKEGGEIITRQVICKVIQLCVDVHGVNMELKMGFNKGQTLQHVHDALLAYPRPEASHNRLVITVAVDLEASPTLTPCSTPQNN